MEEKTLNVPIDLCVYALKNRKVSALQLSIYWKLSSSGHLIYSKDLIERSCEDLSFSKSKFYKCLKDLYNSHWITYNQGKYSIRLVSLLKVNSLIKGKWSHYSVVSLKDIDTFKEFLIASVITRYGKINSGLGRYKLPEQDKGRRSRKSSQSTETRFIFVLRWLEDTIYISRSAASRYRTAAIDAGYLTMQHRFQPTFFQPNEYKFLKSKCDATCLKLYYNKLYRELPPILTSKVQVKKYRKSRQHI